LLREVAPSAAIGIKLAKLGNNMYSYEKKMGIYKDVVIGFIGAFSPKKVLDVGCGRGELVHPFIENGIETYGIDGSHYGIQEGIRRFREMWGYNFGKEKQPYFKLDIESEIFPFRDNYFDFVTIIDVIEHLYSSRHCLNQIKRILNPEGHLLIVTHKPESKYVIGDKTHVNIHPKEKWIELFNQCGFFEPPDAMDRLKMYARCKPASTDEGKKYCTNGDFVARERQVLNALDNHQILVILKKTE